MSLEKIKDKFTNIEGLKVSYNQRMALHTSFKVGGPADILLVPKNEKAFLKALEICKNEDVPVVIMGNGSNLIVRDKGIRGVVIKLSGGLNEIRVDGNTVFAQAGVMLSKLSKFAARNNLSGLEFAEGIPGTLGGAIAMNAGAYDSEMKNIIKKSSCVNMSGEIFEFDNAQHEFQYRNSKIKKEKLIVISTEIVLMPQENDIIVKKMKEFSKLRNLKQPLDLPSAGSTFKRPEGYYAGKLIEDCGLKGCKIGGAEVSMKHSGFIVNKDSATADDVIKLIKLVQEKVLKDTGVQIETEVVVIGEE